MKTLWLHTVNDDPVNEKNFRNQENLRRLCAKLVQITDDVLFGDIWEHPELSKVTAVLSPSRANRRWEHRATALPPETRPRERRHGGRVHRNHQPSGILLRVAQGNVRLSR